MKKGLLIDVVAKTITDIQITDYHDIYKLIGNGCDLFAVPVEFPNGDTIYIDDEGLLKEVHGGFFMNGWSYPLCGNAVILGQDEEGDIADCMSGIDEMRRSIIFVSKEYAEVWQQNALNTAPTIITF